MDDGQMVFGNLYGYEDDEIEQREKEIKEIINRIIDKNDVGMIRDFADYRNYMSYEIVINNADIKDGKLSRQARYNSGAGTQIPYTLILSAALSLLYNARVNSTRLIFIDEPFEKMSDQTMIYADNPDCNFWHFGDIDVGGFQIHQHLCGATGISFRLFCMELQELCNEKFRFALLKLTENDIVRAGKLAEKPAYREILQEMMKKGVKMEQEIISLFLMEKGD